jgi:hypothetical protein
MEKGKYIYDIHSLSANDGELYLWYGQDDEYIVLDCEELYKDLANVIRLVVEQNKEMQQYHKERIMKSVTKI